jgi:hypothetical protein
MWVDITTKYPCENPIIMYPSPYLQQKEMLKLWHDHDDVLNAIPAEILS